MKTFMLAALLAVLPMQVQAQTAFWDGNKLVDHLREWEKIDTAPSEANGFDAGQYNGFVVGAFDGYSTAGVICPLGRVSVGQAAAIVAAYLKANPKQWHFAAIYLVRKALKEAFPCG